MKNFRPYPEAEDYETLEERILFPNAEAKEYQELEDNIVNEKLSGEITVLSTWVNPCDTCPCKTCRKYWDYEPIYIPPYVYPDSTNTPWFPNYPWALITTSDGSDITVGTTTGSGQEAIPSTSGYWANQ